MLILSLYFYVLVMYKTVSTIKKEQELVVFYTFSQKKFSYLLDDIKTVRLNSRGGSITFYDGTKLNLLTSLYVIEDQQGKNRRNLNENDFPNADFIKTI